jgi:hypothetical protein
MKKYKRPMRYTAEMSRWSKKKPKGFNWRFDYKNYDELLGYRITVTAARFNTLSEARRWAEGFGRAADECTICDRLENTVGLHVRDTTGEGLRWYRTPVPVPNQDTYLPARGCEPTCPETWAWADRGAC